MAAIDATNRVRVVAVVPTYNRGELVSQVVGGVLSQTTSVEKVFVVDNASTDGTGDYLRESGQLDDERVSYIRLESNTGSSGGFHVGFEQAMDASADWVWALDDDAIPDRRCLEALLVEVDRNRETSRVGAYMSYQQQFDGRTLYYGLPRSILEALRYGYGCPGPKVKPGDPAAPVDWFTIVSALLSAEAIRQVGLPRPDLFYYADPLDYSLRFRTAGFEALIVPESLVDHRREVSGGINVPGWRRYYLYRNTIFVLRNEGRSLGLPVQIAAVARMTVGGLARMVRLSVNRDWNGVRLVAKGIIDGYRGRLGQRVKPHAA